MSPITTEEKKSTTTNSSTDSHDEDDTKSDTEMIDNTNLLYIPVRLPCGVEVKARPGVLSNCPMFLHELNNDLEGCFEVLPRSVHRLIKRIKIWINESYMLGSADKPNVVDFSTAHHEEEWLIWAHDNPEKARGIEVYNCYEYLRTRLHWNGCGIMLHELCHLIHQLVLPDGLENAKIKDLYERTKSAGKYKKVIRRDWAGRKVDYDQAYAMVNHKEFFAEMSVCFLSCNYLELDNKEMTMKDCSPPLLNPKVIETVEQKYLDDKFSENPYMLESDYLRLCGINDTSPEGECWAGGQKPNTIIATLSRLICLNNKRLWGPQKMPHCNKFYPFTRGQLKSHDPDLLALLSEVWVDIAEWDDESLDDSKQGIFACWIH